MSRATKAPSPTGARRISTSAPNAAWRNPGPLMANMTEEGPKP